MSYGMRRHVGRGQQSDQRTPEAWSPATAYGSAIHHAIQATEDGYDDAGAVQQAWNEWGAHLNPEDLEMLHQDIATYRQRDFPNTRLIASEDEYRVPLFEHNGEQIFFRFKLDRLVERLDAPGVFLHVDYKSSSHPKSELEVHSDRQMWAYNWGIHEVFPEVDQLHQFYDQLKFGQVPTRKSAAQRLQIRDWMIARITAILEDDDYGDDGLLRPTYNQWCPWCPIMESCAVVPQLTDFALTRIAALAPQRPKKKKDGTDSKKMENVPLDPARLGEYVKQLEKSKRARQVIERFEKAVKEIIRDLPEQDRAKLGYKLQTRNNNTFPPRAAEALHEALGERFYELVTITQAGLERNIVEDDDLLAWALGLAEKEAGTPAVVPS